MLPLIIMFFYPIFLPFASWSLNLPQISRNFETCHIQDSSFCDVTLPWHLSKKHRQHHLSNVDIKTIFCNIRSITLIREIMTTLCDTFFYIVFKIGLPNTCPTSQLIVPLNHFLPFVYLGPFLYLTKL